MAKSPAKKPVAKKTAVKKPAAKKPAAKKTAAKPKAKATKTKKTRQPVMTAVPKAAKPPRAPRAPKAAKPATAKNHTILVPGNALFGNPKRVDNVIREALSDFSMPELLAAPAKFFSKEALASPASEVFKEALLAKARSHEDAKNATLSEAETHTFITNQAIAKKTLLEVIKEEKAKTDKPGGSASFSSVISTAWFFAAGGKAKSVVTEKLKAEDKAIRDALTVVNKAFEGKTISDPVDVGRVLFAIKESDLPNRQLAEIIALYHHSMAWDRSQPTSVTPIRLGSSNRVVLLRSLWVQIIEDVMGHPSATTLVREAVAKGEHKKKFGSGPDEAPQQTALEKVVEDAQNAPPELVRVTKDEDGGVVVVDAAPAPKAATKPRAGKVVKTEYSEVFKGKDVFITQMGNNAWSIFTKKGGAGKTVTDQEFKTLVAARKWLTDEGKKVAAPKKPAKKEEDAGSSAVEQIQYLLLTRYKLKPADAAKRLAAKLKAADPEDVTNKTAFAAWLKKLCKKVPNDKAMEAALKLKPTAAAATKTTPKSAVKKPAAKKPVGRATTKAPPKGMI